ncbi:energy transducer TonB [Kerstersia similis]|uniref:energy transducer TonB n=1 Tax=Kerstersia similis TaxID=206505 RepID=UPI0039EF4031
MLHNLNNWSTQRYPLGLRVGAGVAVVALHAALFGALFLAEGDPPVQEEPEAVMVRFVEISPDPQLSKAPQADTPPAPPPPPPVKPEPEPEPEPDEPEVEPDPEPEPVIEPEPEIKPPVVEEAPKVKPQPKPKPRPKPVAPPAVTPVQEPVEDAPPSDAPPSDLPPSGDPDAKGAPSGPQMGTPPDQPRMIGHVDYLGRRPLPDYPQASQQRREQGRVVIRVLINTNGEVEDAQVQQSSGFERLDRSALAAARKSRFKPYTENGVPYPAMADIPFDFVLRNRR